MWNVITNNDITYDGSIGLTITGLVTGQGTVQDGLVIPEKINGTDAQFTITQIGQDAFNGYAGLTGDVVVPTSVSAINSGMFSNCPNIRSVTFLTTAVLSFNSRANGLDLGSFMGDDGLEYIDMSASAGLKNLPYTLERDYIAGGTVYAPQPFKNLPDHTVVYLPKDAVYLNPDGYVFNVVGDPMPLPFSEATYDPQYTITSTNTDGSKQVGWKVIGYDSDGDGGFSMREQPKWINPDNSTLEGTGSSNQTIRIRRNNKAMPNLLEVVIDSMQSARPLGTTAAPYDLSMHDIYGAATPMNTANCYIISGPGTYMLPLVYGNAIKNGATNTQAFYPNVTGVTTGLAGNAPALARFVDNSGNGITQPWVNDQVTDDATTASIVWTDQTNSSTLLTITSTIQTYNGNEYVVFTVPNTIVPGNALVSVKNNSGNILWSWHLWFAPKSSLNPINITNNAGTDYLLSTQNLGFVPETSEGFEARNTEVYVQQDISGKIAHFNLSEEGNITAQSGNSALYEWGRKDPFVQGQFSIDGGTVHWSSGYPTGTGNDYFPYTTANGWGSFTNNVTIQSGISNPKTFYKWMNPGDGNWTSNEYTNLWSANNNAPIIANNVTTSTNGAKSFTGPTVVKTIYDPSPVGFSVPTNDVFTGFATGSNTPSTEGGGTPCTGINAVNTDPITLGGFYFYTNNKKTNTIFFEAGGQINYLTGNPFGVNENLYYSTAQPFQTGDGCSMVYITKPAMDGNTQIDPNEGLYTTYSNNMSRGQAIRPMVNNN